MVATAAGNKVSKHLHGGGLKSCKLRMRVKFNVLVQIYSVGFLLIHILALSPQVMVYLACRYILAKHIQVWNQNSLGYGMESWWCRLYCKPFSGAQLLELWYRVLEALLYLLLTRVIWSSHADLSGSGPHELIVLSEPALLVGGSVTQYINNQPPSW